MNNDRITLRRIVSPDAPRRWSFAIDGPAELTHLREREIWFESSDEIAASDLLDSAVAATLMLAMRNGIDIRVDGPISRKLYYNAQEYQLRWTAWRPDLFSTVEVDAAEIVEPLHSGRHRAVQAFSGGLDSIFTLATHTRIRSTAARRPLDRAVFVHGLDIPLDDMSGFRLAAEKARRITDDAGVTLGLLATNFRAAITINWELCFSAAVASVLLRYAPRYSEGLIAGGLAFPTSVLPSSNPVTDPLLSGELDVIHDGGTFSRIDKIRAIADWTVAADNMRVCWRSLDRSRNCGKCEKCLRTALTFRALGLPVPRSLERDVAPAEIASVKINNDTQFHELKEVLTLAENNLVRANWVGALRDRLTTYQRDAVLARAQRGRASGSRRAQPRLSFPSI